MADSSRPGSTPTPAPTSDGGFAEALREGVRAARLALEQAQLAQDDHAVAACRSRLDSLLRTAAEHEIEPAGLR